MPHHPQRRSVRVPVPRTRQTAELVYGGERIKVRLVDESAGGFRIAVYKPLDFPAGALAVLQTAFAEIEVECVGVEAHDGRTEFGLRRLCERPLRAQVGWRGNLALVMRVLLGDPNSPTRLFTAPVTFCSIISLVVVLVILRSPQWRAAVASLPGCSWLGVGGVAPGEGGGGTIGRNEPEYTPEQRVSLQLHGEVLPRVALLRRLQSADLAEILSLTSPQAEQLTHLADAALTEIDALSPEAVGEDAAAVVSSMREQLESVDAQITAQLNPAQRSLWESLKSRSK